MDDGPATKKAKADTDPAITQAKETWTKFLRDGVLKRQTIHRSDLY